MNFPNKDRGRILPDTGLVVHLISLSIVVFIGIAGVGCQDQPPADKPASDSDELVISTDSEPATTPAGEYVLRMLIWEGYAPDQYVQDFEKHIEAKYGKKVRLQISYTDGGSNDFYDKIRARVVDVVTITHHLFKDERYNFISKGMLLPLDLGNIPNHKNLVPSLRSADFHSKGGEVYGVPVCRGRYRLAYNEDLLPEAPDSWNVLWDPAYKGKYTLAANEYMYNINITALAMGYPVEAISKYKHLNNPEFKQKLRQLTENAHTFWVGQDHADDLSGLSVAAVWGDAFSELDRRGESWATTIPKEGTPFWIDNYAITWTLAEKPFLRKVAEEWIDKLLQPSFQVDHVIRELSQMPVVIGLEAELSPEEKKRMHLGAFAPDQERLIPLETVSRINRNGLKHLWDEAMEGIVVP